MKSFSIVCPEILRLEVQDGLCGRRAMENGPYIGSVPVEDDMHLRDEGVNVRAAANYSSDILLAKTCDHGKEKEPVARSVLGAVRSSFPS